MFGEDLTDYQLAVLQSVTCNVGNVDHQIARMEKVKSWLEREEDQDSGGLEAALAVLLKEGLIFEKDHKGERAFGLTSDGYRCHRLDVSGICL